MHAAATSNAPTPAAPTASPTRQAALGIDSGAVEVAQMMRSIASPSSPACASASFEASVARVAQSSPSSTKRRSFIPVRSTTQATTPPMTKVVSAVPTAKTREFPNRRRMCQLA